MSQQTFIPFPPWYANGNHKRKEPVEKTRKKTYTFVGIIGDRAIKVSASDIEQAKLKIAIMEGERRLSIYSTCKNRRRKFYPMKNLKVYLKVNKLESNCRFIVIFTGASQIQRFTWFPADMTKMRVKKYCTEIIAPISIFPPKIMIVRSSDYYDDDNF